MGPLGALDPSYGSLNVFETNCISELFTFQISIVLYQLPEYIMTSKGGNTWKFHFRLRSYNAFQWEFSSILLLHLPYLKNSTYIWGLHP